VTGEAERRGEIAQRGEAGRHGEAERERLRQTFDGVTRSYQAARPEYPAALYDDLLAVTALPPGDRILEIGCATGKATLPLARRGFQVTCIELGADLARAARANLAGYDVSVVEGSFELWRPPAGISFGLVFAATAWHWIDPAVKYQRAWAALRPGGHLAFWEAAHVFPEDGDPIFAELQQVYDEIGEGDPPGTETPRPGELPSGADDIEASGLFSVLHVRQFDWEVVYTASEYIDLLNTFSGHIAMADWQRERLYSFIRTKLAERAEGTLRRHWGAVLRVARRSQ
jgi:SAM-dependent methyltransferase